MSCEVEECCVGEVFVCFQTLFASERSESRTHRDLVWFMKSFLDARQR